MSKEKFIEELSKELCISKNILTKYIAIVGTNKENIKDYVENCSLAIVRKDNDFNVDYTAVMLNNKDITIKQLQQENEQLKKEVNDWKQRFESSEKRLNQNMVNSVNVLSYKQNKIEELNQQLSEKNKELAELKQWKEELENNYHFQILAEQNQRIKELEKQLEESFSQEDVEGLIKDRDITIKSLKEQLAEKDKEIAELEREVGTLKFNLKETEMELSVCQDVVKRNKLAVDKIRHEICEKITFYLKENLKPIPNKKGCFAEINREELFEFLDQIERGDE